MNTRVIIPAALVAALATLLAGCGSSAEEAAKAPEGSNYYKGEMDAKPKAGGATEP